MDPDNQKDCIWWARGIVEGNPNPNYNVADIYGNKIEVQVEAQNVHAQIAVAKGLFNSSLSNIRGVRPALWVSISAIDKSIIE